ncbi:MAG TPA: OB-fold domain-containing protein [Acidimicrobiales bacterium]|nr:OB-fold domain-containing protein [Acidimicrobiales bacterium]
MTKLIEPPASEAAAPFWDATREQRLVLPYSAVTGEPVWYPREADPADPRRPFEWREASGAGTVYAVSVQHKPGPGRDPAEGPYAVALVDLDEGVRMMSNVVDCPPDEVTVGMAVRVVWHPLSDGRHLPQFAPA